MVLQNLMGSLALDASVQSVLTKLNAGVSLTAGTASIGTVVPTVVPDAQLNNTIAANGGSVAIATGGRGTTAVEITGVWVGTLQFQGTVDPSGTAAADANWYAVNGPAPTVSVPASTTTANGLFRINSAGYTAIRVKATAWTSGTATAWFNASHAGSMVTLAEPITMGADPDTVSTGTIAATDAVVAAPTGDGSVLTGTPTAGSYVQVAAPGGDSTWDAQVTGPFGGGTIYFEGSFDGGVSWLPLNGRQTGIINTVLGFSTAVAGVWRGNTSGTTHVRARIKGATSPSVAVTLRVASGLGALFLNASIPAGTNSIGSVGLLAGTNYVGQVRLTDGTNNPAVKAASTAVASTDPSLAVALHPSSPLPAGTNALGQVSLPPSTLVVTATAAAATAVTATLPAPGAGLSHYITHVRFERFMTAAGTGAGTAVLTGGTNHSLVFNLPTDAATIGTQSVPVDYRPTTPLKVTAANTATTFTTPVVTATIYRITVTYYTAV